jgi:hypothetical protein
VATMTDGGARADNALEGITMAQQLIDIPLPCAAVFACFPYVCMRPLNQQSYMHWLRPRSMGLHTSHVTCCPTVPPSSNKPTDPATAIQMAVSAVFGAVPTSIKALLGSLSNTSQSARPSGLGAMSTAANAGLGNAPRSASPFIAVTKDAGAHASSLMPATLTTFSTIEEAKTAMNMSYEASLMATAWHGPKSMLAQFRTLSQQITSQSMAVSMSASGGNTSSIIANGKAHADAIAAKLAASMGISLNPTAITWQQVQGVNVRGRLIFDGVKSYSATFSVTGGPTFNVIAALRTVQETFWDNIYSVQPWLVQQVRCACHNDDVCPGSGHEALPVSAFPTEDERLQMCGTYVYLY